MSRSSFIAAIETEAALVADTFLAVVLQLAVFPVLGLAVMPVQSLGMGGALTAVSLQIVRSLRPLVARIRLCGTT